MEKTTSLAKKLQSKAIEHKHLQHLTLKQGEMFGWDHTACAITYNPEDTKSSTYLLHEFGHAILGHSDYNYDVDLLKMERAAWAEAQSLAEEHSIFIDSDLVEDALDSYRDWLHARSLCPTCSATGIQVSKSNYTCIACSTNWRVNDARRCALRRYPTKKRSV